MLKFTKEMVISCVLDTRIAALVYIYKDLICIYDVIADRYRDVELNTDYFCIEHNLRFGLMEIMSMVINVDELYCLYNNGIYIVK